MKVKIVENGVEKLVEASYIIVGDKTLQEIVNDINELKNTLIAFVEKENKREQELKKLVGRI